MNCDKLLLDWRRVKRQGKFSSTGGTFESHWTSTARLKLGSPQPIRCCPATVCFLHWVHGDQETSDRQTADFAPGNNKNHQKKPALKLGCWNVRTMMTGLSKDLPDVSDSRKTVFIKDELRRLHVDIATLQETRFADSGTQKEKDYTFFWQGKSSDEPRQL